jgi:hypothetical protein
VSHSLEAVDQTRLPIRPPVTLRSDGSIQRKAMSKASQWLTNSALALGSVCFTLASTELVLRAIPSLPSISSTQIPTREFGDDIPSELVSRAQADVRSNLEQA